jgi:hypothetical protein
MPKPPAPSTLLISNSATRVPAGSAAASDPAVGTEKDGVASLMQPAYQGDAACPARAGPDSLASLRTITRPASPRATRPALPTPATPAMTNRRRLLATCLALPWAVPAAAALERPSRWY